METVVFNDFPPAWPVGEVLWEQEERRAMPRYLRLPTGVTAEGEIVPMTRLRSAERDRLALQDEAFRHITAVIRPQRNEMSGHMEFHEGRLMEVLEDLADNLAPDRARSSWLPT